MIDKPYIAVGTPIHLNGYGRHVQPERTPWLHAAITAAHGLGHEPPGQSAAMRNAWSLIPYDCDSGWAAVWWDPSDGIRLAMTTRPSRIGPTNCQLKFGAAVKIHTPPMRARCDHTIKLRAITPVSIARHVNKQRLEHDLPTDQTITHALHNIASKLRLRTDEIKAGIVSFEVRQERWRLKGKMGAVGGWVGDVTLRCTPTAAWLLDAASRGLGLGSRVAFGLGRIIVG
jgi:hypothetical protein